MSLTFWGIRTDRPTFQGETVLSDIHIIIFFRNKCAVPRIGVFWRSLSSTQPLLSSSRATHFRAIVSGTTQTFPLRVEMHQGVAAMSDVFCLPRHISGNQLKYWSSGLPNISRVLTWIFYMYWLVSRYFTWRVLILHRNWAQLCAGASVEPQFRHFQQQQCSDNLLSYYIYIHVTNLVGVK